MRARLARFRPQFQRGGDVQPRAEPQFQQRERAPPAPGVTYTAGDGVTITNGRINATLGSSVDGGEIEDGSVELADLAALSKSAG